MNILIDKIDEHILTDFRGWKLSDKGYVVRTAYVGYFNGKRKQKKQFLHRVILGIKDPSIHVDHVNGDPLDNRRTNLRTCNIKENARNRGKQRNNTSGYKGVSYRKDRDIWTARIRVNQKLIHLGYFATAIEASNAYITASRKYFGEFSYV